MLLSERLLLAIRVAQEESDLPEQVAMQLQVLAAHVDDNAAARTVTEQVIELLGHYDPYGDVGCFGGGSDLATLEKAIRLLVGQLDLSGSGRA